MNTQTYGGHSYNWKVPERLAEIMCADGVSTLYTKDVPSRYYDEVAAILLMSGAKREFDIIYNPFNHKIMATTEAYFNEEGGKVLRLYSSEIRNFYKLLEIEGGVP